MSWRRLGEWTRLHVLALVWAFFLGPMVVLWSLDQDLGRNVAPLLVVALAATGWLAPWWLGVLILAGASVVFAMAGTALIEVNLDLGAGPLTNGLPIFFVGLLFLGIGRAARWGWETLGQSRQARREAAEQRARADQLALLFRAAAHEIGNPLTPLRLQANLLRRHPAATDAQVKDMVDRMDRSVARLVHLTRDLSDAARSLQGQLKCDLRRVDLAPVLRDVATEQGQVCRHQGLAWTDSVPENLVWHADADRIAQAVVNLCQNALRYTRTGRIDLSVHLDADALVIEVKDTGIGFSAKDAARLFQPFTRLNPTIKGVGLGLWIVRGIAQAHGGTITLTSPGPDQGATANLRLPAPAP